MNKTVERVAWVAIVTLGVILAMLGSAYAAQDPTAQLPLPGLPPAKLGGHWWSGLGIGILGGVQAVFVGLLKNRDKATGKLPALDYKLCLKTLAVGLVVGMAAHFLKWSPSDMAGWMVTTPIGGVVTAGVEDLVDMVLKKVFPPAAPGA